MRHPQDCRCVDGLTSRGSALLIWEYGLASFDLWQEMDLSRWVLPKSKIKKEATEGVQKEYGKLPFDDGCVTISIISRPEDPREHRRRPELPHRQRTVDAGTRLDMAAVPGTHSIIGTGCRQTCKPILPKET
jgi:hypothetical protein